MPKLNQKGVVHLLLPVILILGLVAAVYLVTSGNPLKLFSKASMSKPTGPETSFTLTGPGDCSGLDCLFPKPQEQFEVKLYARSDIEQANLFTAKMTFPKDLVEVVEIKEDGFINNWVENFYDNDTGEIDLTGGVTAPGYQTQVNEPAALMATIVFKAKTLGKGTVALTDSSAIYSNLNNIDILTIKRNYDISVEVAPPPAPTPTPTSIPAGSRVFVTRTSYSGNLGGLAGADVKCQTSANEANLGGIWKAWLSDSTTSATSRLIHDTGPYKLVNGTIIANGWDDLTDGTLSSPINITELGTTFNVSWVWTGTFANGTIRQADNDGNCAGWVNYYTNGGTTGDSSRKDSGWSDYGATACYKNNPLYCFEQPSITPTPTPFPTNKGDGNKDGKINLIDMSVIHTDWMKTSSMTNFRAGIDMNDDKLINTFDFGLHRNLLIELRIIRKK